MISPHPELDELDRRFAREVLGSRSYHQALEIFTALWIEARALNPDFPSSDWLTDLEPDLELARVLNGLPEAS